MSEPFWAIAYHTNSHSPRAARWYRVARMIVVDEQTFELYWHPSLETRGKSRVAIAAAAKAIGLELASGTFRDAPWPRSGGAVMVRGK